MVYLCTDKTLDSTRPRMHNGHKTEVESLVRYSIIKTSQRLNKKSARKSIRSVPGGNESIVDEEQKRIGLVPSQLSSVALFANANDAEL